MSANRVVERRSGVFKEVHYRTKELVQPSTVDELEAMIFEVSWSLQTLTMVIFVNSILQCILISLVCGHVSCWNGHTSWQCTCYAGYNCCRIYTRMIKT